MAVDKQVGMDVVYLCRCAVNGQVPDKEAVEAMDIERVYKLSSFHMVAAAAGMALESAGCMNEEFRQSIGAAQRKTMMLQNALQAVKTGLEQAGIWYMPLKGAVLKDLYPRFGMREFADYDVLFDASRAEDVRSIMEDLGFETKQFGIDHHDMYIKKPKLKLEMHRSLFSPRHEEKLRKYYQDIEGRLIGDGFEKHLSPEDFYLYFLAHEYKHYSQSGTGIRSLMDTYVCLKAFTLDMNYVTAEAEKLGIREFEKKNRSISLYLFGDGTFSDDDRKMLDYILSSGTFGNCNNRVANFLHKNKWTKMQYLLYRFFVPISRKNKNYDAYAQLYPRFYNNRLFLPFLPIYRTIRAVRDGRLKAEIKAVKSAKDESLID